MIDGRTQIPERFHHEAMRLGLDVEALLEMRALEYMATYGAWPQSVMAWVRLKIRKAVLS